MSLILHSLFLPLKGFYCRLRDTAGKFTQPGKSLSVELTFRPRSPLTWLVATWIATVDVKADITGAETKLSRKPEKKEQDFEVSHLVISYVGFETWVLVLETLAFVNL